MKLALQLLNDALNAAQEDHERIELLNLLTLFQVFLASDEASALASETAALARSLDNPRALATALRHLALLHMARAEYVASFDALTESLKLTMLHPDPGSDAWGYSMMGALYQTTGDSLHAGLAHNRAVARAESAGLAIVQALAIQGRALYYYDTKRYTEAEAEYAEAHRLFQTILTEHTDRFGLPIPNEPYVFSLNNAVTAKILLARNLNGTANLLHAEGQYTEAFKLHAQSLKIFESLQSIQGQARCLHDMGRVLMEERKYAQALAHFALALQMREDINAHDGRMTTLMEMAELYRRQNDYDKAMLFLRQALQLAGSTRNLPKEIRAHQALSNCYQHKRQIDMVEFHKAQAEELQRQIEREAESAISAHRTDFIELGLE